MPEPRVVGIVPVHNHCQWVLQAVLSIAHQSFPAQQIVVSDDGSTDGSADAIISRLYRPKTFRNADGSVLRTDGQLTETKTPVTVIRRNKACGPSAARNIAIQAAWENADAFVFCDSDDYLLPGKVEKSVAKWQEDPHIIGLAYSDYSELHADGRETVTYAEPFSRGRLVQDCIVNPKSLVSKKAFATVGLFDETLRTCEDFDEWMRITEMFVAVHIPEVLAVKRVGNHSSTATVPLERWQADYRRVKEKMMERANVK